jgi:hypothetical protein
MGMIAIHNVQRSLYHFMEPYEHDLQAKYDQRLVSKLALRYSNTITGISDSYGNNWRLKATNTK